MGDEKKKRGKIRKFFLFATLAGIAGAVMQTLKRRRAGVDETEWQELPPPSAT